MLKKSIRLILLGLLFFSISIQSTIAFAEVESPLGLEVLTDKDDYQADDEISHSIGVINHSDHRANDILLRVDLPKELEAIGNDFKVNENNELTWEIESLDSLEEATIKLKTKLRAEVAEVPTIVPEQEESPDIGNESTDKLETVAPKTGDETSILGYIVILGLSIAGLVIGFFVYRKKYLAKTVTIGLLLAAILISPISSINAAGKTYSHTETRSIKIGDAEYDLIFTLEATITEVEMTEKLTLTGDWEMDEEDSLNWKLNWTPINASESYDVYRSDTGEANDFELVAENILVDYYYAQDLEINGVSYYYVTTSGENLQSNTIKVDGLIDTDEDDLTDMIEYMLGTDPLNPDTDGDGLPDGYERLILGTDPLKIDSNENGISDADEDFDSDGLTNLEEYKLETDPYLSDTDFDGLSDYDEINKHNTNPLNEDTDGDGMLDGFEIEYGTDPLNKDSNGNGIIDGDESYEYIARTNESDRDPNISPSVTMEMQGRDLGDITISKVSANDPFLNSEIPGYIGSSFNFLTDVDFEDATMTFEYDESLVTSKFRPEIFYYNETEQRLDRLDNQDHDDQNHTVSVQVDHFSTYILLDAHEWDQLWEEVVIPPIIDEDGQMRHVDIVFAIDSSGSMSWEDPNDIRKTASKAFVDKLREEDRAAVVDFDSRAKLLVELTTDKSRVHYAIDMIDDIGGTNLYLGLTEAIDEIAKNGKEEHLKYVIFLTDGDGSWNDRAIQYAKDQNVIVYTIGLGDGVSDELLEKIAVGTGGKYFPSENAEQLEEIFEQTASDTIDRLKDTDNDGIPDYLEKSGIRLGNGVYIKSKDLTDPESTGLDYENNDSDDDGLLDGEEINLQFKENEEGKIYFTYYSDPTKKDSDGDGLVDAYIDENEKVVEVDSAPLEYSISDRILALIAGLSYNNLSAYLNRDLGEVIDSGYTFKNIDDDDLELLRDWKIIQANDSGVGYWKDFWDSGLGSVSLKYTKSNDRSMVVYGLRGTEVDDDLLNDGYADLRLSLGKDSFQSQNATRGFRELAAGSRHTNFYLTGHSLGGRLVQDVNYSIYELQEENTSRIYRKPVHSATFNALGYNRATYSISLKNSIKDDLQTKINNYYYEKDFVGENLGNSLAFKRLGNNIGPWTAKDENGNTIDTSIIELSKVHGITLFHYDKNLIYPNVNIIE